MEREEKGVRAVEGKGKRGRREKTGRTGRNAARTLLLLLLCLILAGDRTSAVNYDKKIKQAKEEKKEYGEKLEELQKELKELENDRKDTLAYIEKLDKKVGELEEKLEEVRADIKTVNKELKAAKKELKEAEASEEIQYTTMKKRIKYMYENGNQEYLEILFGSADIRDLLNRAEYIEKISAYDRKMFEKYQAVKQKITEKKQEIENHLTRLEGLKEEAVAEREILKDIKRKKKKQLKKIEAATEESQNKTNRVAARIAKAEADVERLLQEKQDEIDRQNGVGSGSSGDSSGGISGKGMCWPVGAAGRISSGFGPRKRPTAGASTYHKGLDIAVPSGTPILAAGAGTVVTAAYSSSAGNYVMISHGKKLYTVYMHCSRLAVSAGQEVSRGQVIGYAGSTGISTGSHLHFGVSKNGAYVNPLTYVGK